MTRILVARAMVFMALGLSGHAIKSGAQILHPTKENLDVRANNVISQSPSSGSSGTLSLLAERLRNARVERVVGQEDGDAVEAMGAISAAVEDEKGRVIVLDRSYQNLRVLDLDPRRSFAVGRAGSGPLEFRTPMSIWLARDGRLAVADAVLGIKLLQIDTPRSSRLVSTRRVVGDITGACLSGENVAAFQVSRASRALVDVIGPKGETKFSFGDQYRSDASLVRVIMSEGTVGCVNDRSYVLALSGIPLIHGYDQRGKRRWVSQIGRFSIGVQEEKIGKSGQRSIGLSDATREFSYVTSLVPILEHFVVIQVAHQNEKSLRARQDYAKLDTYLVDARDGRGTFVGSALPKVTAERPNGFLAFSNDPFPRVLVYRMEARR